MVSNSRSVALVLLLHAAAIAGCASSPARQAAEGALADCRTLFARMDRAVAQAGVADAGAHRPDGFPYLRSNRFLASFAGELREDQLVDWLARLRQLDRQARQAELDNLNDPAWGTAQGHALDGCARRWLQADLADPARMRRLRDSVAVPDDYSVLARGLGVYPAALPFLVGGIQRFRGEILQDYALPWAQLRESGNWLLWEPAGRPGETAATVWNRDGLGIPRLNRAEARALLQRHAPLFLIDTQGSYDRPGRPLATGDGFAAEPLIYQQISFTRFGREVLTQLVYSIWFERRPATEGLVDPYAGRLDGVVWRVTLDARGEPLLYDSIHSCGCYHQMFPARQLAHKASGPWQERPLQPQGIVPWDRVAVVLDNGRHYLRRVLPAASARQWSALAPHTLAWRDYADLRSQSQPDGSRASLFGAQGMVAGTQRLERYWLWPTGVKDPGAMRQHGRHATAFAGRAHFDDPWQLERWFWPN